MIKAKVIKKNKKESSYPKLMISNNGQIVLMRACEEGVCLIKTADHQSDVGEFSHTWCMEVFRDFNGTIELSNEEN